MTDEEQSRLERGRRKCRAKTARGNCYLDAAFAEAEAARMSLATGQCIKAFRCLFGAHWHLAGERSREERRQRGDREIETEAHLVDEKRRPT